MVKTLGYYLRHVRYEYEKKKFKITKFDTILIFESNSTGGSVAFLRGILYQINFIFSS